MEERKKDEASLGESLVPFGLSSQESRVLGLAMRGLTDQGIADEMGLALGTVRVYWKRVRAKSGRTRSENIAGQARHDSEAAGERASRIYESVLRATGTPFAVLDGATGKVLRVEPSFAALLGTTVGDLVGQPIGDRIPRLEKLPASVPLAKTRIVESEGKVLDLAILGERASIFIVWHKP